jgi:hypothetical protein
MSSLTNLFAEELRGQVYLLKKVKNAEREI